MTESGQVVIGVIGEFDATFAPHLATNLALAHAAKQLGVQVDVRWLSTDDLNDDLRQGAEAHGLWCAPGSPYRSMDGALRALRFGRERGVPTLGTCGGCHHAIIEFARHVLGYEDAQHAEQDPYASRLVISQLECSLVGQTLPVMLEPGSRAAELYGAAEVNEQYYCNFALNPDYQKPLDEAGMRVSGYDDEGDARVLEIPEHPFYLATIFVPQTRSTPEQPHPLVVGFVQAASQRAAVAAAMDAA
jgi:CTP synthase (UTP-ammonia lyase)